MNKKLLALSILCLLSFGLMTSGQVNQPGNLQPGAAAPALVLEKILQAPDGAKADWESLRGKVVVVEFWATWCAPCLILQPHLNELAEKFKDQPVYFISISDEPEEIVAPFLQRRTLKGWVGLNTKHETFKAYGITAIPRTIVVDQQGKIVAAMQGTQQGQELSEAMLSQLVAKNGLASDQPKAQTAAPPGNLASGATPMTVGPGGGQPTAPNGSKSSGAEPALLDISIRPTKLFKPPARISSNPMAFTASGSDLIGLLRALKSSSPRTPIPNSRILIPTELQNQRFDITAIVQNDKAQSLKSLVVNALENALGVKIQQVTREMDAYVLTAPKGLTGSLRPTKATVFHGSSGDGVLAAAGADLSFLVSDLEAALKTPVINETNLQGKFDWDLLFDGKNPKSIIEAIRKEFGLEITLAKRPVELIVVEKQ